jgi:hypothetical protein
MTVHKLTAGDGCTYLTRQVAAHDASTRSFGGLGEYYSANGEAPGIWMGRGLADVTDFPVGERRSCCPTFRCLVAAAGSLICVVDGNRRILFCIAAPGLCRSARPLISWIAAWGRLGCPDEAELA